MHILMKNITFTYTYPFLISTFSQHVSFLIIFHILFVSSYTLLLTLVTLYYHHIAVLCFSYHVIYYIHLICVYLSFAFMFHAYINLRSGYGKELYVPKGIIIVRDSDLYLYDLNGAAIMIRTGSMSLIQTRPRYL